MSPFLVAKLSKDDAVKTLYKSRKAYDPLTVGAFVVSVVVTFGLNAAARAGAEKLSDASHIWFGVTAGTGLGVMTEAFTKSQHQGCEPLLQALSDVASTYDSDHNKWTAEQKQAWSTNSERLGSLEATAAYLQNPWAGATHSAV